VKKSRLIKIGVAVAAIGAFGYLFMQSLEDTRSEAYTIPRAHLQGGMLALESASRANDPLLVLRLSPDLASGLFRQIFARAMESLNSSAAPSIPLVLRSEFDGVIGDQFTQEALVAAAKAAGLEGTALSPHCLVHRRISEPGGVRQTYLVYFEAPAIAQFRKQIGLEPDALSPVVFVAGAGTDFNSWLPQRINPQVDCLAPIEIAP